MHKNFVAVAAAFALLGAASAASATTFAGNWSATYNSSDSAGLPIKINGDASSPASGNFSSLPDIFNGGVQTAFLFNVGSSDGTPAGACFFFVCSGDSNNLNDSPFSVTLNFTAPGTGTGSISGTTESLSAYFVYGRLTWSNGGNTTASLGSLGTVNVHLNDVSFTSDPLQGQEYATFSLTGPSAVPEPMSWALMLMGFGGLGAMLRANRRQGAALTAA
jgi:hypothetical protein